MKANETSWDLDVAHKFCSGNKPSLQHDRICGCFYCLQIFAPSEIKEFIIADNDCDRLGTAICPYCGIDSIISESAGYPITEDFLKSMYRRWFE